MEEQQRRNDHHRVKPPENHQMAPAPPQKCPRCDSANTKFCYYNNYSLSQPRYFCKACRRYWTHGGTLRNVPVGGGCRKAKRPKPSPSPSSSEIARSQPLPPAIQSQQPMRPFPPIISNTFYSGGSFLSSLAAMQSLSTGVTHSAALNLGGGGRQYDTLLQGVSLPSLKPQPPPQHQFQLQNDHYFPPRPSWTQSFINRAPTSNAAAASSSFWTGDNQAGSSFNPDNWQDSNQGFDPSSH
ncbi:hypothetical protein AAHA92_30331 [Salvia divinorum]|uniref:Dof zinc finger protein n=1 Tax=Salvia divinorum TaxID=28513 RepID=A0ABD1G190_SALDI